MTVSKAPESNFNISLKRLNQRLHNAKWKPSRLSLDKYYLCSTLYFMQAAACLHIVWNLCIYGRIFSLQRMSGLSSNFETFMTFIWFAPINAPTTVTSERSVPSFLMLRLDICPKRSKLLWAEENAWYTFKRTCPGLLEFCYLISVCRIDPTVLIGLWEESLTRALTFLDSS